MPVEQGRVRLYVCGVTVYDHSHIGHARSAIVFDAVSRYLRSIGYDVIYVRNFTDIDDKIINRASAEGRNWREVAETHIASFKEDMASLGVLPPTFEPKATDHIDDMIALIGQLIEKGYAYPLNGSVYFSVAKDKAYGTLSGRTLDEMVAGVAHRGGRTEKKIPSISPCGRNRNRESPAWDSPFGQAGRGGISSVPP